MADEMTYKDILRMVESACAAVFYSGAKGVETSVIESATQIYIAQMNTRTPKEKRADFTCKDCTEWDNDECECSHWYGFKENDFCSYGTPKERGGEK